MAIYKPTANMAAEAVLWTECAGKSVGCIFLVEPSEEAGVRG
jgi:hypothetical protein